MTAQPKKSGTTQSVAIRDSRFTALSACLGDPPLLKGEDQAGYETLSAQIECAVQPMDAIEYLWVRDVIDLTWEIQRLRRLKAAYLTACAPEGLTRLLQRDSYRHSEYEGLVRGWSRGSKEEIRKINNFLKVCKLPADAIAAQTFANKIDQIESIDRMIASAEGRRVNIIREVDRHREALARQLRQATEIEDAEFTVIGEDMNEAAE